ncbi:MAG: hypothetical protein AW09_002163 [Candidatus Accumulibacter phosphatis]|uniref:Uncharacterized protein n=1 Tax=Candidatus Accumulibacter phosphatis TaxID=327160 RepID=A0A080LVK1_9PROT|nr:MAG: hypothetical protein AW09_002163 [Candidatus Accumulibacter phosphatis]
MTPTGMASFSPPTTSTWLFGFGGVSQGRTHSLCSITANQELIEWALSCRKPNWRCQKSKTSGGVRKLLVQFTVVEPPTQRPCRMLIALSAVLREADS